MKTKIPPPLWLLIAGAVMWLAAHSVVALPFALPYASVMLVAFVACGVLTGLLALRQFRSAQTTVNPLKPQEATALVRTGIFSKSRNPMYLGLLLILIGWAVWLGAMINVLVLILFVVVLTELQIKPEEAALRKLFGQEYEDYCQQVRRWL